MYCVGVPENSSLLSAPFSERDLHFGCAEVVRESPFAEDEQTEFDVDRFAVSEAPQQVRWSRDGTVLCRGAQGELSSSLGLSLRAQVFPTLAFL